jgi:hypothetical protein
MAITRKPAHVRPAPPVDVEDLINRGGSTPAREDATAADQIVPVILRLPSSMLKNIDKAVRGRPVRIPRHTWLLEAVYEKLSRENHPDSEEVSE